MVGAEDNDEGLFGNGERRKIKPQLKRLSRGDQQLAIGNEFDDALVIWLVRVFVEAMMQSGRAGEELQRRV